MKRFVTFTTLLVLLAAAATAACAGDRLPAFPGAEGFGAGSIGGRGGQVIKVTNLATRGPGSLQAACSAEGPRIVVFDVSGVIPGNVVIEHGRISIMGQTAPGAGVTIEGIIEGVGIIQDPWAEANKLPGLKYYARHGRKAADEFPVAKVTTHSPNTAYQLVLQRTAAFHATQSLGGLSEKYEPELAREVVPGENN